MEEAEKWAVQIGDRTESISSDLASILGFVAPDPDDKSRTARDHSLGRSALIRLCDGLAAGLSGDAAAIFAISKKTEREAASHNALVGSSKVVAYSGKNVLQTLLGE